MQRYRVSYHSQLGAEFGTCYWICWADSWDAAAEICLRDAQYALYVTGIELIK